MDYRFTAILIILMVLMAMFLEPGYVPRWHINTNMIKQYIAIFYVAICLGILMYFMWPTKKNQLEFIEEEIRKVETKQKILTEKEKQLEKLATEKDWEQVDKDSNK